MYGRVSSGCGSGGATAAAVSAVSARVGSRSLSVSCSTSTSSSFSISASTSASSSSASLSSLHSLRRVDPSSSFSSSFSSSSASLPVRRALHSSTSHSSSLANLVVSTATNTLTNGLLAHDDFLTNGLPPPRFTLSKLASGPFSLHSVFSDNAHIDPFVCVQPDLHSISESIKQVIGSDHAVLSQIARYFFEVNGKRVRPAIVLLLSRAMNRGVDAAVAQPYLCTNISSTTPAAARSSITSSSCSSAATSTTASTPTSATPSSSSQSTSPTYMNGSHAHPHSHPHTHMRTHVTLTSSTRDRLDDVLPSQQRLAEIAEMIHTASLLHDDVIDEASTRRNIPSVNAAFGNKFAILGGDYLLARASVALARLRHPQVIELMSTIVEHLVKGEIMQLRATPVSSVTSAGGALNRAALDTLFSTYITKTYYKTASLLANSCESAAILGAHSVHMQQIAYEYGKNVGIAFQIIDDILDVVGNATMMGKAGSGSDLSNGIVTAPVLFALEESAEMREMSQRKWSEPGDVERAMTICREGSGVHRAHQLAEQFADNAVAAIMQLHPSAARSSLIRLVEHVLRRDR